MQNRNSPHEFGFDLSENINKDEIQKEGECYLHLSRAGNCPGCIISGVKWVLDRKVVGMVNSLS